MCYTESNSGTWHFCGIFPAMEQKVEGWVIMKKILFVASEAVPFIKTGGLADVVGSLPKCFDKEYFDVRVMIPKYLCIKDKFLSNLTYVNHFYMDYLGQSRYVGILEYVYEGITFYFIDNESYFWGDKPYGDWYYDLEKFSFFSQAALSALPVIGWRPDVIHCHDWQTGLIPVYLKGRFGEGEFFRGIKSVMTIHNLKFQGVWDVKTIQRFSGLPDYFFTPDKLEAYKDGNMLKGGLVYADAITTVSNTYAEEIKTPFYGEGLDGLMRARSGDLRGIVNGIDYDVFNPETDPDIVQNYNAKNFRKEKVKNKRALQEELGLAKDDKKFMIGIVSRLTNQKGLDLIQCVMDEICTDDVQLVVLGTGDENYENMFRHYDWKYHDRVSAQIYYSEPLSHKIYAACDAFLMPSLFEPCGLSQLMALRYGTVPIVRETGGLKDTVWPYNEFEGTGTGFSFANYNAHEMLNIIRYAKHIYYDKKREWNKIVDRAMAVDFSWKTSAGKYQELYDWLDNEPQLFHPADVDYVHSPYRIGEMKNVISINGGVELDLMGQENAESAGTRQLSGIGGGKGFICLASTHKKKDGSLKSNIVPFIPGGSTVSAPRTMIQYVATEYGIAKLTGLTLNERADAMIAIAHPDFRDELCRYAEENFK